MMVLPVLVVIEIESCALLFVKDEHGVELTSRLAGESPEVDGAAVQEYAHGAVGEVLACDGAEELPPASSGELPMALHVLLVDVAGALPHGPGFPHRLTTSGAWTPVLLMRD